MTVRRLPIGVAAAAALLLGGCSSATSVAEEPILADHGLAGMAAEEMVDHLDRLGGSDRPAQLMASVRPEELRLSDDDQELAVDLPDDRFYLSVAPYVTQTHECFFHSLTTCQGELTGEDVQVTIVDAATGEVLVDERRTTFDNGFVGFWLPRDVDGTIRVSHDGLAGESAFSTRADSPTCLTSLQLV